MDVTYVGKSDGDYFDLFHYLDGEGEPVLEIAVCPDMKIWIAGVRGFGVAVPQETSGRAHRHRDEWFEKNGIDTSYVCLGSIAAYVKPRIATLMGRVYCPSHKNTEATSG
jgi:hypothetical protein